jgi:hypothetical protein
MLAIYLNDHLAGATAGRELARRAAASNRGSAYGRFLTGLAQDIEEDRQSLLQIMRRLDVSVDRLKLIGGWGAEKLGRLKLNGRLLGYSPLSRLVELEGLALGVHGKLSLWRSLLEVDPPGIEEAVLRELAARAERQLAGLEKQRLRAVKKALA